MAPTLEELADTLKAFMDSAASLDELVRDAHIQTWNGAADITSGVTLTLMTALTPCKIRAVGLVMEYNGVPASDTTYWTFTLRKGTDARGWTNLAARATRNTGANANGPIVPRVPWMFDGATIADVQLAPDDLLQLVLARTGTPQKVDLPIAISIGYVPA